MERGLPCTRANAAANLKAVMRLREPAVRLYVQYHKTNLKT